MKLYRQSVTFANNRNDTHWAGSQAEAAAKRAAWTKEGAKRNDIQTDEVDVPTDKKGLLEFLNGRG